MSYTGDDIAEPYSLYKPALREITIPKVKLDTQGTGRPARGDQRGRFYVMSPKASTSVRSDMNARPMMKMESAILS
jgi:hypothetical protein